MTDCVSHSVARRFLGSESSTPRTAVIAHVDLDGNWWGWSFDDNVRRMHLIPIQYEGAGRVWLEDGKGNRSFEIDRVPTGTDLDLDSLRASVAQTRQIIEPAWLRSCEAKGWLKYSPVDATISLYPGTQHELVRPLNDTASMPELLQLDTQANTATLRITLNRLIWVGADDGSDAESA
ncbi:MAG: hypothetical protein ABI895_12225 [Deltaproteobacteria bacterium]